MRGMRESVVRAPALSGEQAAAYAVVLDTAPVLLVTETLTIAAQADATVVVVRWRKTSKRAVAATLRLLNSAKVTLAGAAISQVDLAEAGGVSESDPTHYYREYKKYYLS